MRIQIALAVFFFYSHLNAQVPAYRLANWSNAGATDTSFNSSIFHFKDFSIDSAHINPDSCMSAALSHFASIGGGTLLIGAGEYTFHSSIHLPSNTHIKGQGKSTRILFDFQNQNKDGFTISGKSITNNITIDSINGRNIYLSQAISDTSISLVKIGFNDSDLLNDAWAYGSIGSLLKVKSVNGHLIEVSDNISLDLFKGRALYLKGIRTAKNCSIQCLYLSRLDASIGQSSNIYIDYGLNCIVSGVESDKTNFSHIVINRSSHCLIERNFIHDAHAYGGGGQGYGVTIQMGSENNLVRDNIFNHLRHSMLLQSGAARNVLSYNYSINPFVTDNPFNDAGGDMVCHGNYPYCNLFEGNVCQNIVVDNSHGKNGPYNTFFRNRAELYGILVSTGQDSQNFIANEIPNSAALKGQFLLNGTGHFRQANTHKGSISDGSFTYTNSLYLNALPSFWNIPYNYWGIGFPNQYLKANNPAFQRQKDSFNLSPCEISIQTSAIPSIDIPYSEIYPNPIKHGEFLHFGDDIYSIKLYDLMGRLIFFSNDTSAFNTESLTSGMYTVIIDEARIYKLLVSE